MIVRDTAIKLLKLGAYVVAGIHWASQPMH
jgi:hypothetical protein